MSFHTILQLQTPNFVRLFNHKIYLLCRYGVSAVDKNDHKRFSGVENAQDRHGIYVYLNTEELICKMYTNAPLGWHHMSVITSQITNT